MLLVLHKYCDCVFYLFDKLKSSNNNNDNNNNNKNNNNDNNNNIDNNNNTFRPELEKIKKIFIFQDMELSSSKGDFTLDGISALR